MKTVLQTTTRDRLTGQLSVSIVTCTNIKYQFKKYSQNVELWHIRSVLASTISLHESLLTCSFNSYVTVFPPTWPVTFANETSELTLFWGQQPLHRLRVWCLADLLMTSSQGIPPRNFRGVVSCSCLAWHYRVKCPFLLYGFNQNWVVSTNLVAPSSVTINIRIAVLEAHRQRFGRWREWFCNFVNAPKIWT
jgi:hypothetical protein